MMSIIKLFLINFVQCAVADVVCGISIKFCHQTLTILGLIQTNITYAQTRVLTEKNIVTFDLFEH